jgi:hypothetical protein
MRAVFQKILDENALSQGLLAIAFVARAATGCNAISKASSLRGGGRGGRHSLLYRTAFQFSVGISSVVRGPSGLVCCLHLPVLLLGPLFPHLAFFFKKVSVSENQSF